MPVIRQGIDLSFMSKDVILGLIDEAEFNISEGQDSRDLILFIEEAEREISKRKSFSQTIS